MTLNLTPDAEAKAKVEMLTELCASVKDHAAGRSMTIEEYCMKALARRQQRHGGHSDTDRPTAQWVI